MSKMRNLVSTLVGLLALIVLAAPLSWLLKAQRALPGLPAPGGQPAASLAQDSSLPTPTIPPEEVVPSQEEPPPTPTIPVEVALPPQQESPLPTPTMPTPYIELTALPQPVLVAQPAPPEVLAGEKIAFLRDQDLWLINLASRSFAQLTVSANVTRLYGWSYDGSKLLLGVGEWPVISESDMPGGTDLWVLDVREGTAAQLTEGLLVLEAYSSPVSGQIAYWTRDGDVYVVGSDGSGRTRLLSSLAADYLTWSPDGAELAFVLLKDPGEWAVRNIAVIRTSDGSIRELASDASENYSPLWSLDGKEILFQSERRRPPDTGVWYVVSADGSNLRHLAGSPPLVSRFLGERKGERHRPCWG